MLDNFFFFPEAEVLETPADQGLEYEDLVFPSVDGTRLNGWYIKGHTDITWLWFHGNGGNIGTTVPAIHQYHHLLGVNIFIFDYRGYGRSEGKPTERGVYLDATAALHYLRSRLGLTSDQTLYFGQSLGGAVAIELATRQPPAALVIEATFSSAQDMARLLVPRLPVHWLVRRKFNSLKRIRKVHCPVLVIHGDRDEVVPIEQGRKLYQAARGPKRWHEVPGAGHNDLWLEGGESYYRALRDLMSILRPMPS